MKTLFRTALLLVCGFPLFACTPHPASDAPYRIEEGTIVFAEPARAEGQCDVLQLRCDPIPVVRVAFIGLGMRGSTAVERFTQLDGVEIVALCDKVPAHVERAQRTLSVHGLPAAQEFTGADDWRRVCELEGVDLIYNCTDWQMHVPIALYAMERGKHVAVEVPAALTVADCWALVDAAERTRRHCMMLENCCYDFFEMTTLNMAREGLFGEIVHVEGAYIHDLRELQFDRRHGYVDMWRLEHNALHTGNPYPTHGLGPLCQVLDIHRGDRMERLVSLSSDQFGMSAYATAKYGAESAEAERPYALGDMNTTLIRTARARASSSSTTSPLRGPTTGSHTIWNEGLRTEMPDPQSGVRSRRPPPNSRTVARPNAAPLRASHYAKSARRRARWAATAAWISSWTTGWSTVCATACRSIRTFTTRPSGRRWRS